MDNRERSELSAWVQSSVDLLAPPAAWQPNPAVARARFESGVEIRPHRRHRYVLLAIAAALLLAVATVPPAHVLAQQAADNGWRRFDQIWDWFTLVRQPLGAMRNPAESLKALQIRQVVNPGSPAPVANVSEAVLHAGFTPRLPDPAILSAAPRLSVTGLRSFASAAQVTVQIGATVNAVWSNASDRRGGNSWSELTLAQAAPPVVRTPPSFNLANFLVATLQDAGLRNRQLATRLSRLLTTAPALLTGYQTTAEFVTARDVGLRSGPATLFEEFTLGESHGNPAVERITLLWSVQDRAYLLTGVPKTPPGMFSLDLAAALASAIDLARSVQ